MPAYTDSAYAFSISLINETGGAVDITGYDLSAKFYKPIPSHQDPITVTEGNGITVTDPTTGIFTINLSPSQVNCLGVGPIRFEAFKNHSNDATRTLLLEGSEVVEGARFDA